MVGIGSHHCQGKQLYCQENKKACKQLGHGQGMQRYAETWNFVPSTMELCRLGCMARSGPEGKLLSMGLAFHQSVKYIHFEAGLP